jgi:hypothetical protein
MVMKTGALKLIIINYKVSDVTGLRYFKNILIMDKIRNMTLFSDSITHM